MSMAHLPPPFLCRRHVHSVVTIPISQRIPFHSPLLLAHGHLAYALPLSSSTRSSYVPSPGYSNPAKPISTSLSSSNILPPHPASPSLDNDSTLSLTQTHLNTVNPHPRQEKTRSSLTKTRRTRFLIRHVQNTFEVRWFSQTPTHSLPPSFSPPIISFLRASPTNPTISVSRRTHFNLRPMYSISPHAVSNTYCKEPLHPRQQLASLDDLNGSQHGQPIPAPGESAFVTEQDVDGRIGDNSEDCGPHDVTMPQDLINCHTIDLSQSSFILSTVTRHSH
ncbi:hypothetical protein NLI96_g12179 [Meripilus lineatus]|uniref:Uncharacterized protein n=1 Tax=Meripilus lineatus TaxID=2056292 RepID=A0AAD5UQJ7_9APHY|nr:hypothetical protein NLI96_g12179 [Physisporinus lineatus]